MSEKFTVYQKTVQDPQKVLPYSEFQKTYGEKNGGEGWIGRKVLAIPMAICSATIVPLYHGSYALYKVAQTIYKAIFDSPEVRKAFNTVSQDYFKAWGYLTTILSDCYGQYWVDSSSHQQKINHGELIRKPVPPPPPPPPPRLIRVSSTGDVAGLRKTWKPKPKEKLKETAKSGAISMDELLKKAEEIKNAKRSKNERKPEVSTPEECRTKQMFNIKMLGRRERLASSPDLSSEKKPGQRQCLGETSVRRNLTKEFENRE